MGHHLSSLVVANEVVRSTRELDRADLKRSLYDLAPGGVYLADNVAIIAGGLLHHPFTLTNCLAVYSLLHFPAGHPEWALPTTLPCGVRTFLGAISEPTPTRSPRRLFFKQ